MAAYDACLAAQTWVARYRLRTGLTPSEDIRPVSDIPSVPDRE